MGGLRIKILVMIVAIIGKHTCNAWDWEAILKKACSPENIHQNKKYCPTTTVKPSECLNGIENVDCQFGEKDKYKRGYIGGASQTVSGLTCQAWNVQTPHKHEFARLGDHNHCRNPDEESGVWCYTTSPNKRWDYCDVRECNGCDKGFSNATFCTAYSNGHTMRRYAGPSEECAKKTIFRGFTDAGKTLIVKTHNELRQRLAAGLETHGNQPGASNMMKLVWNDEIAASAQRWADQCIVDTHSTEWKCDGSGVGQNLFRVTQGNKLTKDQVMASLDEGPRAWYKEVARPNTNQGKWNGKPFPSSWIQPFKLEEINYGHFTQMAWANTAEIGCGLVLFEDQGRYTTNIVCNYAIMGNAPGLPMYKIGKGCSDCPKGTTCDQTYDSLCTGTCEEWACQK